MHKFTQNKKIPNKRKYEKLLLLLLFWGDSGCLSALFSKKKRQKIINKSLKAIN